MAPTLTIELWKLPSGMWLVDSPQLKGLMIANRDLEAALAAVPAHIRELWQAMEGEKAVNAQQVAAYRPVIEAIGKDPPARTTSLFRRFIPESL